MLDPNNNRVSPNAVGNGSNGNNGSNPSNGNNSIRPVMPNPLVQNVINTNLLQGQIPQIPFRPQVPQPQQLRPQVQQRPPQSQVPQPQQQSQQQLQQQSSLNKDEEMSRYYRALMKAITDLNNDINSSKEQLVGQVTERVINNIAYQITDLKDLLNQVVTAIEQNFQINNLAQQNIQQNFQQLIEALNTSNASNASIKSEVSLLVEANNKYISKEDFNKGVNFIVNRFSSSLSNLSGSINSANASGSNNLSNGSSDNNGEVRENIQYLTSSINNFAGQLALVQKHQQVQQAQLKQLIDSLITNAANASIFGNNLAVNPAINKSTSTNTNNSNPSQSTNPIKQLLEKDISLPFLSYQVTVKTLLIAVVIVGVLLLVAIGS